MSDFIQVKGTRFYYKEKDYFIKGANYWQGINLASIQGGDRTRLMLELDQLKAMGVNNLRIMASSEGPDDQPYRMRPSLQPKPGEYNQDMLVALDFLLNELAKRSMTAVMTLSNFWHWSGGFAQYISWVTGESIPYPDTRDKWDAFTVFTQRFYDDPKIYTQVNQLFKNHIRFIQNRRNSINGKVYHEDPVIMSWQIANEPQLAPRDWYEEIGEFIKKGAPNQLVSSGIEGKYDEKDFINAHASKYIDYCTCHCWVENWGIYDPTQKESLQNAIDYLKNFMKSRFDWSSRLNKPILLEEFGLARDAWRSDKYDPQTSTSHKDIYYDTLYRQLAIGYSGSNFWAYGGISRSSDQPNEYDMVWLGDPPHEPRGWYSVYNTDTTVSVISKHFCQKLLTNHHLSPFS